MTIDRKHVMYLELAKIFVMLRDLQHCKQTHVIKYSSSGLDREWKILHKRLAFLENPPEWIIALRICFNTHTTEEWHKACQEVDRWWNTYEQGKQARKMGVPRDAGIHSTLDDGTDTLTPWLRGWDEQQEAGNNELIFPPLVEDW